MISTAESSESDSDFVGLPLFLGEGCAGVSIFLKLKVIKDNSKLTFLIYGTCAHITIIF